MVENQSVSSQPSQQFDLLVWDARQRCVLSQLMNSIWLVHSHNIDSLLSQSHCDKQIKAQMTTRFCQVPSSDVCKPFMFPHKVPLGKGFGREIQSGTLHKMSALFLHRVLALDINVLRVI